MPQGSGALPGWLVKVINDVIKSLKQVAAYLDYVIVIQTRRPTKKHPCPLRATAQAQPQALPLESQTRRDGHRFPEPLHLVGGRVAKRRGSVGFYSHAHDPRPETAAFSPGWPLVLSKVYA